MIHIKFEKINVLLYVGLAKVGPIHGKESKVFHDQETILKDVV